jgi:hypothetical protein
VYSLVLPAKRVEYPIASIQAVDIETHEWTDGQPSYSVSVEMADGRKFTAGSSWSRSEIEQERDQVRAFLGKAPDVGNSLVPD